MTLVQSAVVGATIGGVGGLLALLGLRAYLALDRIPLVYRIAASGAVLAGVVLGGALGAAGTAINVIVAAIMVSGLLATLSVIDLATRRLPNALVAALLAWAFIQTLLGINNWRMSVAGMAFGAFMFILLAVIGRGALGAGDVKLAIAIGAVLGLPAAIWGLVLGVLAGGLGAVLLLVTRSATRKDKMAYGPYLAAGAWVTYMSVLGIW